MNEAPHDGSKASRSVQPPDGSRSSQDGKGSEIGSASQRTGKLLWRRHRECRSIRKGSHEGEITAKKQVGKMIVEDRRRG